MEKQERMGYDRSITMFSPDGRLLQVEYAKKTVKQGSTAIGMVCRDGVLLVSDKRILSKLIIPESVEKMFQIDDHIAATASGIISDARVLVERAQLKAQQHRITYDTMIDTLSIVRDICALKQFCTQSGGLRPFGVSLLVGGIDEDGPKLYLTDPTGIFFRFTAAVIGEGEMEIEKELQKRYKPNISIQEGLELSLSALKHLIGSNICPERLDGVYIKLKEKRNHRISRDKLKATLAKVK